MTERPPRVAFFTDAFHEVNGVANTSRQFEAFARRRELPFFSCHAGPADQCAVEGSITTVEWVRSSVSLRLEADLYFDLRFHRHRQRIGEALAAFEPDLVHVTGPSDSGILGALLAHQLRVPLVASWHTQVHEYGGRRLERVLSPLPVSWRRAAGRLAEREILRWTLRFYSFARVLYAPNEELIRMLHERTGKPAYLMSRGVDTHLFHPERRTASGDLFTLGYAGRLSPEKNVRMLAAIERELEKLGKDRFRFLIVGHGREQEWLQANVRRAEFPGVLRGEALARAYADMDAFVFPSRTDTFGNVILEAQASGVPAFVTSGGGPKFLIQPSVSGFIADEPAEFARMIADLMDAPGKLQAMRSAARANASRQSWDEVFERVYEGYERSFRLSERPVSARLRTVPTRPVG
ncbi:MAG: glycosyltransferase [Bryobacterales bacterium]|nr:glycosyltransferase [Bryobacterales bacterium]